ncbi:MAG: LemA family protein [Bacteroidetes bacterium]|nr:LemA family protein [Bacteroidota bacterium]
MIFLLVIVGISALVFALTYNSLIAKKNAVENSFGTMDALLKKRYDLIPNIVATAQQYMNYEKDTLTKITELRAKAVSGNISTDEKTVLSNQVAPLLRNILVSAENYPELKANSNFTELQHTLRDLEEQISSSRTGYNTIVTEFNNAIEMFPSNFVAGLMGLQRKPVFEIPAEERKNVNVRELFNQK